MTSERTRRATPEAAQAERSLSQIYNITADWLRKGRNARVVKEFGSQKVDSWGPQAIYAPGTTSPMELKKAIVLLDSRNAYGLAFGRRRRTRMDKHDYPTFQFGFFSSSDWTSPKHPSFTELDRLMQLAASSPYNFRSGEFYFDGRKLRTNCWIDEQRYGGEDINHWEESAISAKGEAAVVNTIKRLVRNFDPV